MKILVPIDFSEASLNAATYATKLAADLGSTDVIVFHVFAPTNIGSDGTPIGDNDQTAYLHISDLIQNLQLALHDKTPSVATDKRIAVGDFATEFKYLLSKESFDIIVMGMAHISKFEEKLLGSSVLDIIDAHKKPVFVITEGVKYGTIKKAALAADLQSDTGKIKFELITNILKPLRADLDLVSILDDPDGELTPGQASRLEEFKNQLAVLHPTHVILEKDNFLRAINNYAETNEADLLIVLPRKQNFFRRLFGLSQSTKLLFGGNLPVMALRY